MPPTGLGAGPSLPLVTPQAAAAPPTRPNPMGFGDGTARGRILIYWGCGERVRAGQPVEIDLARLSSGQVPPAMAALNIRPMTPPAAGTSAHLWRMAEPALANARFRRPARWSATMSSAAIIRPEIRFALDQSQDFLPPIRLTSNTRRRLGRGAGRLAAGRQRAGLFLMSFGSRRGRHDGDVELERGPGQHDGLRLSLAEGEIARLLQQRVLLSPQTTQCTVPAEVAGGVQGASLMMNAFGPEANFSHPVRPASAPRNWAPEWTVKLRTRASYMGMLGRTWRR